MHSKALGTKCEDNNLQGETFLGQIRGDSMEVLMHEGSQSFELATNTSF
jgi:hypothetical protein